VVNMESSWFFAFCGAAATDQSMDLRGRWIMTMPKNSARCP
jgi:hypothetical protein